MIPIEDYIQKPKSERQAHLRLEEPCIERGGFSSYCKGLLAHVLDTTIPSGKKIHVCHACHNGPCSNPNHLYWGTPSENRRDFVESGRPVNRTATGENLRRMGNTNATGKTHKKSEEHKQKIADAIRRKHKERVTAQQ
jgi:hypothetical protein